MLSHTHTHNQTAVMLLRDQALRQRQRIDERRELRNQRSCHGSDCPIDRGRGRVANDLVMAPWRTPSKSIANSLSKFQNRADRLGAERNALGRIELGHWRDREPRKFCAPSAALWPIAPTSPGASDQVSGWS